MLEFNAEGAAKIEFRKSVSGRAVAEVVFENGLAVGRWRKVMVSFDKVPEGSLGKVLMMHSDGNAKIAFVGIASNAKSATTWVVNANSGNISVRSQENQQAEEKCARVPKDQFYRLFPLPNAHDTPIQRRVKQARLRRCDVRALILYTGPMYVLLNAILRDFGFCGAVAPDIEFASYEFWVPWKAVDINTWVKRSGHRFTNTIHALASAIKKLQGLAAEEPSTRLYRGLDGLDVAAFAASCGFTDRAFMSMTKDQRVALQYSGVHKGLVGTVLGVETSTTNGGAVIVEFSQAQSLKSRLCSGTMQSMYWV